LSRERLLLAALALAIAAAMAVATVSAGDPNGDQHGIIRALMAL